MADILQITEDIPVDDNIYMSMNIKNITQLQEQI